MFIQKIIKIVQLQSSNVEELSYLQIVNSFEAKPQLIFRQNLILKIWVIFWLGLMLTSIIIFKLLKMSQQIDRQFTLFTKQSKQTLFDILSTNIKFNEKPFTQQDLKIDLVMRLKVPNQLIMPKDYEISIQNIFKSLPSEYEEVYKEALDYVYYLTVTDPNSKLTAIPDTTITTRCMTSLKSLIRTQPIKRKYLNNRLDEEEVIIDCEYQYLPFLDTFTVFYNLVMVVLERVCGFHVRTFLMKNKEDSDLQDTNVVYFLLSQSNQNLMKMADKVELKKEMDMRDIDYTINTPTDKKGRPIKFNSYFKSQPYFDRFLSNQKFINRLLGIKDMGLQHDICEEAELTEQDAAKYTKYFQELFDQIMKLHKTNDISISHWEKSFLFDFNRQKINQGCLSLYYETQFKRLIHKKMKELNKKYGYPYYEYPSSFFEFRMLSRSKPFFQKLSHILAFKRYTVTHSGQISLFTKLQRIKLSYLNLERYFKVENFPKYGFDIYALHDNFQKFGDITYEDSDMWLQKQQGRPKEVKIDTLSSAWKPFLPFRCDIKKIRDYMGQKFAFQIMIKIYMTTYFLLITPISFAAQLFLEIVYEHTLTYKYSLLVLFIMVLSLNLFIAVWTKAEDTFLQNFVSSSKQKTYRNGYKGPYFRNLTNDDPNGYSYEKTILQRILSGVSYIVVCSILVIEGGFFWGMRLAIVSTYQRLSFINWRYASATHLIFYGIYFLVNYFVYNIIVVRIIDFLTRLQQYPTQQDHRKVARQFKIFVSFGIQLLPPLFFYIVQPLLGYSCFNAQCTDQFSTFVYTRYQILFVGLLIKFYKCIWIILTGAVNKAVYHEDERISQYLSFEGRLNYILNIIRSEYKKGESDEDLHTQSLGLVFYVIFKISFPSTSIFTFLMLQLQYIFDRLQHFNHIRRPIPTRNTIFRLEGTFRTVLHLCILFNAWVITFSLQFVQYDFSDYVETFVLNITAENILTLKLFVVVFLFIGYEIISYIFSTFFSSLMYDPLELRKKVMYKKYLNRIRSKPSRLKLSNLTPLKTMFRTFTYDSILQFKRNKHKIYQYMKKEMLKYQQLSLFQTYEIGSNPNLQTMQSNHRIAIT